MAQTKNAPAKTKKAPAPAAVIDFSGDMNAGLENTDRDSFAIPFLRVIQKTSPILDELDKAKAGQFINTVTNELFNDVVFIPCAFRRSFIAWAPRGDGAGYHGEFTPEDVAELRLDGKAVEVDGEGLMMGEDKLTDTRSHYGLIETKDGLQQVVLALSSTQIKKSKQLMSILSAVRVNGALPPTWLSRIKLSTQIEKNDQGSWSGIKIENIGTISDQETYDAGKAFHATVSSGEAKANYEKTEEGF